MKIPSSQSSRGFTLIELLTVIAIIAILMGLLFPVMGKVKETARKVQAKNDAVQIVTAVKAYYTEYGKYPVGAQSGDDTNDYKASSTDHKDLMDILRVPLATGTYPLNPRKIVFLDVPAAKKTAHAEARGGICSDGHFHDPWGGIYQIRIDNNYNNIVPNPYAPDTGAGFASVNTGVIVWSLGKDQAGGSGSKNSGEGDDDVISWQ